MSRWPTVLLGEALELAYGKSLPKNARSDGGQIPVYGSNGITGWHNEALINEPVVIVGRKGSAGAVQLTDGPSFPIDTTYFVRVRNRFLFDTKFLFYLLRWLDLSKLKTATGVPGLTREDAYRERIPVPPIANQLKVVDQLSRAESIVHLRREAQQKAAELVPAIFNEMFGDPGVNPRGFPKMPLSNVSEVISGVAKGRSLDSGESIEVPYMRVANVKDGYLDLSDVKTITIKRSEMSKLRIEVGDLLMTEGGDPDKLGRAALWAGEIHDCVHQNHVFKVRSDRSQIIPEYLKALAGSPYGKAYFLSVAKKTTGIASINKTQLSAFPVVVPPMHAQERFSRLVSDSESIEAQQKLAGSKAIAAFQALLARSFSR